MQPRSDGSYLLPQEVVDEYKDIAGGGRERVLKMWAASSHDKVGLYIDIDICTYYIYTLNCLEHVSQYGFRVKPCWLGGLHQAMQAQERKYQ